MASIIWEMNIPSSSSGEIYTVRAYDDGTATCSCRFGSLRGLVGPGVQRCKHIESAFRQKELGFQGTELPPAWTDQELDFDTAAWIRRLCQIYSPFVFLRELAEATLREDNDHLARLVKKEAGEGNFRPNPLPKLERAVLTRLVFALSEFDDEALDTPIDRSTADRVGHEFLKKAVRANSAAREGKRLVQSTNKKIAEALRNSLCGDNRAWDRLFSEQ